MNISQLTGFFIWHVNRLSDKSLKTKRSHHFYNNVVNDHTLYPEYKLPEIIRKKYLQSGSLIDANTHGALSKAAGTKKTLSSVVRRTSVTSSQGRILFRLSRFYKPGKVIEMGTSAGISTLYMALGNPQSEVITVEGNPGLAGTASECFTENNIGNIKVINNDFSPALQKLKADGIFQYSGLKLVFIDGDHSYKPVISYYNYFKENLTYPYILIFHDIWWSEGMQKAWKEIVLSHKKNDIIDLFSMGIVFVGL
jgi:predicted O-methyltransferase YrrM